MKDIKTILFSLILAAGTGPGQAQDPVFSHFFANSLHLNPSLAGIEGPARVYIGYRNQWPNAGGAFITYQAAYDQYIDKIQGGLGVRLLNDQQGGVINTYNLDVMYSYQFTASRKWSFAGGLQAGIGQRSFDALSLEFGDMINPVTGEVSSLTENINGYNEFYPDFAAGMAAFYQNYYGGIAIHHLLSPDVTKNDDPTGTISRKYTAHIGAVFPIMEKRLGRELMKLSPNLVFMQQLSVQQINYGLDMIYRDFVLGLYTRHDLLFNYGNLIFTAGYSSKSLRFRYSYDVKLSSPTVRIPNMAAHEFSLLIVYESLNRRKKHSTIKCPKI